MTWQSVSALLLKVRSLNFYADRNEYVLPNRPGQAVPWRQLPLLTCSSPPECYGPGSLAAPTRPAPEPSPCLPRSRQREARRPHSSCHAHQRPSARRLGKRHPALRAAGLQTRRIPSRFLLRYSLLACLLLRESNRASSILPLFIRDFTVPSGTRNTWAISL